MTLSPDELRSACKRNVNPVTIDMGDEWSIRSLPSGQMERWRDVRCFTSGAFPLDSVEESSPPGAHSKPTVIKVPRASPLCPVVAP